MSNMYELLNNNLKNFRKKTDFVPSVAIVLGSGLGGFAKKIVPVASIPYTELNAFPVTTNQMHQGRFILGYLSDVPVVAMQGRIHYYEGYSMEDVVMPIRFMRMMGAKTLLLTNAAGGINPDFVPGDLMLITDHISSFVPSPLIGPNIDEFGCRFPDMTHVYNQEYCEIIKSCAQNNNINLRAGIYLQTTGPNYETPAEIRAYRSLGADAVGMSTVCEAIAAVHCGMKVCGISCISNMAAGITGEILSDDDVITVAASVSKKLEKLILDSVLTIG